MCSFLKKILSVAELYHLPFPSFKVKDLTLETAISQDAIPGLVTVLENSPQLKKLTVQPKLVSIFSNYKHLLLFFHFYWRA